MNSEEPPRHEDTKVQAMNETKAIRKLSQKMPFGAQRIKGLLSPTKGHVWIHDEDCQGLTLRVGSTGQRVFYCYRYSRSEQRPLRTRLGPFPALSVERARALVHMLIADDTDRALDMISPRHRDRDRSISAELARAHALPRSTAESPLQGDDLQVSLKFRDQPPYVPTQLRCVPGVLPFTFPGPWLHLMIPIIYLLIDEGTVVYVGRSDRGFLRSLSHASMKLERKKFTEIWFVPLPPDTSPGPWLASEERNWIDCFDPVYNRDSITLKRRKASAGS